MTAVVMVKYSTMISREAATTKGKVEVKKQAKRAVFFWSAN
jgi:hypothetical protein